MSYLEDKWKGLPNQQVKATNVKQAWSYVLICYHHLETFALYVSC
jgi:hypothetical protein